DRKAGAAGNGDARGSGSDLVHPIEANRAAGFDFTITGDPRLRPGQRVRASVEKFNVREYRIHSVTHKLTMSGGYVCTGRAIEACKGGDCRSREIALSVPSASAVADKLARMTDSQLQARATAEIGQIKSYTAGESSAAKHLGTVHFGQSF